MGRRNLGDSQFKILMGQEYELEKNILRGDGYRKSEEYRENQIPHTEGNETTERLAKEHGVSRATVERSIDLYKSHQAVIATSKTISPLQGE